MVTVFGLGIVIWAQILDEAVCVIRCINVILKILLSGVISVLEHHQGCLFQACLHTTTNRHVNAISVSMKIIHFLPNLIW